MIRTSNNKPFTIVLDSYAEESFQLYCVVRALLDYPLINKDPDYEYDDYIGKLYASAFTFICLNYLEILDIKQYFEDFELFNEDMNFIEDKKELVELAKKIEINDYRDFEDLVKNLISYYKKLIAADINRLFPSEQLKIRLFSSIFEMEEFGQGYQPSVPGGGYIYSSMFLPN